jgi:hypothetical protein
MVGPPLKFQGVTEKDWKISPSECRRSLKVDFSCIDHFFAIVIFLELVVFPE